MATRTRPVRPLRRKDLIAAGVTPMQMRGPRWQRVGPGLYVPGWVDVRRPDQRIVQAAGRLRPGGAVGGWAAARRLGVTQLDGLDWDGTTLQPVPLCPGPDHQIRPEPSIAVWADWLHTTEIVDADGVPATISPRTCFDGMRRAPTLVDAVVFADLMLHAGLVTLEQMREYVAQRWGWRGVPRARRALGLADPMARNRWETRMRMAWVLDAGLPRPLCNPPVFDLYGNLLGYPDLIDPEAGTVGEFDGGLHRELAQHGQDNEREERFEDSGLVVTRAVSLDFKDRGALAARMRRAHVRGRGRDRRRDGWTLEPPHDWDAAGSEADLTDLLAALDGR